MAPTAARSLSATVAGTSAVIAVTSDDAGDVKDEPEVSVFPEAAEEYIEMEPPKFGKDGLRRNGTWLVRDFGVHRFKGHDFEIPASDSLGDIQKGWPRDASDYPQ